MKEISLEDISFSYDRNSKEKARCLKAISLKITQGKVLGVFGPSGAGKTTLIFLICGLLKPDHGRILIDGEALSDRKEDWKRLRSKMGVAFQFPEDMFFKESISEEFWNILGEKGYARENATRMAKQALNWAGLDADSLWSRHPLHLGYGQLRRLSLALVWAQDRDFLILDEPTVGLDCLTKKRLLKDIVHYCHQKKKLSIIACHDTSALLPLVDHGLILQGGEIVFQGTREKLLDKPECLASAGLSLPPLADLAIKLKRDGLPVNQIWKNLDQAIEGITEMIPRGNAKDEST